MPASRAAGQLVGVEQQLLTEPRLDPRVEAGAEPGRRRRLPRHRPGQVAGERLRVVAEPGQRRSRTGWTAAGRRSSGDRSRRRLLEQPLDLVVPLLRPGRAAACPRRSSGSAGARRADQLGGRDAGGRPPRCGARSARAGRARRRRRGWPCPWPACRSHGVGLAAPGRHRLAGGERGTADGPRPVLRWPAQHHAGHGEQVPGAGPRDVPEPELLERLVLLGAPWPARRCRRGCGRRASGRSRASPRSAAGHHERHGQPAGAAAVGRELPLGDADQEHRVPLEALGPVDGEQLDRVGLGRGGHVEALAELVLGLEPGQQRGQRDLAVDRLELGDRLHEQVEVVAPGGRGRADRRGELDVDAGGVDDPADQVEDRLADRGAQPAQLVGQQPEPRPAPRASSRGRPGPPARRRARRSRSGRRPRRPRAAGPATSAKLSPPGWLPASSRARRPSSARSRGPIAQRGPASRVSSAALAVTSWTRVSVATTSETSGSRSRPLRPTISTGISRSVSASKTAAAWELSRVSTPISRQAGSAISPWRRDHPVGQPGQLVVVRLVHDRAYLAVGRRPAWARAAAARGGSS